MNSKQVDDNLLINEWQLGQQLNHAVTNGTRDKFNLLLSFLSDDARDFAQFSIEKSYQGELQQLALRDSLSLPKKAQPLVNDGISLAQAKSYSESLHKNDLNAIRLQSLLHNDPLLSRSKPLSMPADIMDNLSFLQQQRLPSEGGGEKVESEQKRSEPTGVGYELLAQYEKLALNSKLQS